VNEATHLPDVTFYNILLSVYECCLFVIVLCLSDNCVKWNKLCSCCNSSWCWCYINRRTDLRYHATGNHSRVDVASRTASLCTDYEKQKLICLPVSYINLLVDTIL